MKLISILLAWITVFQTGQDIYVCKTAKVSLFSSAPVEDISATSTKGASVFNASTGELAFSVPIRSFEFPKSLMQEHFNTEYMDSDKFPTATFKGKINEHVDVTKDGITTITATGDLTVHGVTKPRTVTGSFVVKSGVISMTSTFTVKCADHNITIPTIVFHNIAETIKMDVSATYSPYKKNKQTAKQHEEVFDIISFACVEHRLNGPKRRYRKETRLYRRVIECAKYR